MTRHCIGPECPHFTVRGYRSLSGEWRPRCELTGDSFCSQWLAHECMAEIELRELQRGMTVLPWRKS